MKACPLLEPAFAPAPLRSITNVGARAGALILAAGLMFTGCVHMEKTSSKPIKGILRDEKGRPLADGQIWAEFLMPGGLFKAQRSVAQGPAISRADGTFTLNLMPITMVQTGTIFDGESFPRFVILHRKKGCYSSLNYKREKEHGFLDTSFEGTNPEPLSSTDLPYFVKEWPEKDQAVVRKYIEGG